ARVCDNIVLMIGDGETLVGNALDVLTEDNLGKAYDCAIARVEHEGRTLFYPL
ncbi:MAG TPA: ABC transporter ATP-binding protein, partial [Gammaproteobacteria bacterium]|nr:ABC transporter ATP-binding protein [Gammaproteobacteria bacterium]